MVDITDFFDSNAPDPLLVEEHRIQTNRDDEDFYAENALDRIRTLRHNVVEVFGREAAFNHMFYGVPLLKSASDCKSGEVDTPHKLAFQSEEGLQQALSVLRKFQPKRG